MAASDSLHCIVREIGSYFWRRCYVRSLYAQSRFTCALTCTAASNSKRMNHFNVNIRVKTAAGSRDRARKLHFDQLHPSSSHPLICLAKTPQCLELLTFKIRRKLPLDRCLSCVTERGPSCVNLSIAAISGRIAFQH